jgi:hypothetical protein
MRLTAADVAGQARALRTTQIDDITVAEDAPVIGVALDAVDPQTGMAPIFVTLR